MSNSLRVGLSVSAFTDLQFAGGHHLADGERNVTNARQLQELFADRGSSEVFCRIPTRRRTRNEAPFDWVIGSLDIAVDRARLAKSLGLKFNPEFGLFCHYGDAPRQPPPDFSEYPEIELAGPWETLSIGEMADAVRIYGRVVATEILATGVEVSVWDIGNEVDAGIAGLAPRPVPNPTMDIVDRGADWYKPCDKVDPALGKMSILELMRLGPEAVISWLQEHVWPHEAQILGAFAEGVRSVDPQARFSTHLAAHSAIEPNLPGAFWEAMRSGGYRPDQIGVSFYPSNGVTTSGNALEDFKRTTETLQDRFGVPLFVAEYGYPAADKGVWDGWNRPVPGYPLTEGGQSDLLRDVLTFARTSGMAGVRPWLPDGFVGVWGLATMALFGPADPSATRGESRPGLAAIAEALA